MPKISLILPIYNCEKDVGAAVASVLCQTFTDFELIAVDDGSSDGSARVIEELAAGDARIRLLRQANGGPSAARNAGIEIAKAEHIAFLDADDMFAPNALKTLYGFALEYDLVAVGFTSFCRKNGKIKNLSSNTCDFLSRNKKEILQKIGYLSGQGYFNQVWNKLYRKSIIAKNSIRFDTAFNIAEDLLFNLQYVNCINSLRCVDAAVYLYYRSSSGLTGRFRENRFELHMEIAKRFEQILSKNDLPPTQAYAFAMRSMFGCFKDLYRKNARHIDKKQYVAQKLDDPYIRTIVESDTRFPSKLFNMLSALTKKRALRRILFLSWGYHVLKRQK